MSTKHAIHFLLVLAGVIFARPASAEHQSTLGTYDLGNVHLIWLDVPPLAQSVRGTRAPSLELIPNPPAPVPPLAPPPPAAKQNVSSTSLKEEQLQMAAKVLLESEGVPVAFNNLTPESQDALKKSIQSDFDGLSPEEQ